MRGLSASESSGARPHFRLIGSVSQLSGGFFRNYTAAQKPFRALLHVIVMRIDDGCFRRSFPGTLCLRDREQRKRQESEQERTNYAAEPWKGHGYLATRQVSEGQREQAIKNPRKLGLRTIPGISCGTELYNLHRVLSLVSITVASRCVVMKYVSMMKCRLLFFGVILLLLASGIPIPQAESADREINVAAAADLSAVMQEVAANYEKRTGVVVKVSFGASGALTQQIQNGAPFDVFFSADMDYPRQLIAGGQADGATLYRYTVGQLVLWVPQDSPLDVEHKGMDVLLDPSVKEISIANPQHAPYGRAAAAALKHYGLYEKLGNRLVLGENVLQAAQFVESGNAQVGFVALAHAMAPAMQGKGKYWVVPAEAYPALDQGVVILSHSPHREDATAFLAFMKTEEAAGLLRRYGFTSPDLKYKLK
jgi:molybdate transport system substrate-binding protein